MKALGNVKETSLKKMLIHMLKSRFFRKGMIAGVQFGSTEREGVWNCRGMEKEERQPIR